MKKTAIILLTGIICACILTGCGSNKEKAQSSVQQSSSSSSSVSSQQKTKTLSEIFKDISKQVKLPEMIYLEKIDDLDRYYEISASDVDEFAGGIDNSGTSQDEIVLIKAKTDKSAENIKSLLQKKYDSKLNQIQNYDASEAAKIKSGKVEINGLYVTMIISKDSEKITEIFKNSI